MGSMTLPIRLLLLIACLAVSSYGSPDQKKSVSMYYRTGDWQPHFGYYPGHMASQHRHSVRNQKTDNSTQLANSYKLNQFVVRMMHNKKFMCSGIMLNSTHLLVPKLCVYKTPLSEIFVRLADDTERAVNSIENSTRFTIEFGEQLLSELKLAQPLKKPLGVAPICLHHVRLSDNVELWTWDKRIEYLIKKSVPQVPEAICKQKIGDPNGVVVTTATSCLENMKLTKKCENTFGLPYVWRGSFCGMNLIGHNCPRFTSVDVYVRLLRVDSYIGEKIRQINALNLDDLIL